LGSLGSLESLGLLKMQGRRRMILVPAGDLRERQISRISLARRGRKDEREPVKWLP
jgi:hypothetical protein